MEFTFLLDESLTKQGRRGKTKIQYLFPQPRGFPITGVAEVVTPLLEERHIGYTVFFNPEAVDTEKKIISSLEGEEIPYDLLVMIPPHRGARVIEESGLGDAQGWIATDRNTLEVKNQQRVFALGDATDLPVSKSGSAAHFEAKVVAASILADIHGSECCRSIDRITPLMYALGRNFSERAIAHRREVVRIGIIPLFGVLIAVLEQQPGRFFSCAEYTDQRERSLQFFPK